jgi:hypothetical protein
MVHKVQLAHKAQPVLMVLLDLKVLPVQMVSMEQMVLMVLKDQ